MVRRVRIALAAAALCCSADVAQAADLAVEGGDVRFPAEASSRGTLAVFSRFERAADGTAGLDVLARRVGADGRPQGDAVLVGKGAAPGPGLVGEAYAVAFDRRRTRWLVAWSGREPGMAQASCGPPQTFPVSTPACVQAKREVFVRVVDADGGVADPARRITATGDPGDAYASGAAPAVAYDSRADRFLLVSVAADPRRLGGTLVSHVLDRAGAPVRDGTTLPLTGNAAATELVSGPDGGYLLGFAGFGGSDPAERELRVRPLTAAGRPRGRTVTVSPSGGPGASGIRLAMDRDRGEALAVWAEARSGASSGFRARRLTVGGRPRGGGVPLPFTVGTGRVDVVGFGRGWLFGVTEERPEIGHAVLVHRGRADGRVVGAARVVSDDDAVTPGLADLGKGRALVGWTLSPVSRGTAEAPPPPRPRVRLVRP